MSNTGWICPRCQKVHAPDVRGCDCKALPDLIGVPWPRSPFDGLPPEPPMPLRLYPMPGCGCTGPCCNVACPHAPKVTCAMG